MACALSRGGGGGGGGGREEVYPRAEIFRWIQT